MTKAKLTGRHSTFTPPAEEVRREVRRYPEVTGISPGIIRRIGSGPSSVKIKAETGAVLLVVRGGASIQEVRIYSTNHEETVTRLSAFITERGWKLKEDNIG